jgi:protoporphyrinogen/coproporphyrinogen III oxidase
MTADARVIVIGGGISGLACCYRLQEIGVQAVLLEESSRTGGVIQTVEYSGFLLEKGPQSFLATEILVNLIRALGLENDLLTADPRAPRYILQRGRLRAVPLAPQALLASELLGMKTKFRLITEPLRRWKPAPAEESVAAFVRRKFGSEILDYLVAPFISGIYAGDPETLSIASAFPQVVQWERDYGSVLCGAVKSRKSGTARPALASFARGMAALPAALARKLGSQILTGARVDSIEAIAGQHDGSRYQVRLLRNGHQDSVSAHAVVFAAPAYVTGKLLAGMSPRLGDLLCALPYAPLAVVSHGYHRRQVGHSLGGFGFLVPRKEGLRTLGTVWNSSLFPGRAPQDTVLLTSFAGGATDLTLVELEDQQIAELVQKEVSRILEISGPPIECAVCRYMRALPQYNLGHSQRLAEIRGELARLPGLYLAGNYLEGPAIGHCIEQAFRTADSTRDFLVR